MMTIYWPCDKTLEISKSVLVKQPWQIWVKSICAWPQLTTAAQNRTACIIPVMYHTSFPVSVISSWIALRSTMAKCQSCYWWPRQSGTKDYMVIQEPTTPGLNDSNRLDTISEIHAHHQCRLNFTKPNYFSINVFWKLLRWFTEHEFVYVCIKCRHICQMLLYYYIKGFLKWFCCHEFRQECL